MGLSFSRMKEILGLSLASVFTLVPQCAHAGFSLSPTSFSNPSALIDSNVVTPIVRTIGFAADHRAYEGAAGLGNAAGIELSLQATAVKLPPSFRDALSSAGLDNLPLPIVPLPRLIAHKGIGSRFDVGMSWIIFKEIKILGFDAKAVVYQPDEGPTWAIRLNYTDANISFSDSGASLGVHTRTMKPEILVSQRLDFFEPYLGVGYQLVNGSLKVNLPLPTPLPSINETVSARGGGGLAFVGLGLKVPGIALRLLIDGEYSTVGAHSLGAKFGFNF
ncbi:MAG: hypothetical protein ACJ763_07235 [Bdellovibrionia bacterium]